MDALLGKWGRPVHEVARAKSGVSISQFVVCPVDRLYEPLKCWPEALLAQPTTQNLVDWLHGWIEILEIEAPPQCRVHQSDRAIRAVHRGDDQEIRRKAEVVAVL